jgi:hypothetical protein
LNEPLPRGEAPLFGTGVLHDGGVAETAAGGAGRFGGIDAALFQSAGAQFNVQPHLFLQIGSEFLALKQVGYSTPESVEHPSTSSR